MFLFEEHLQTMYLLVKYGGLSPYSWFKSHICALSNCYSFVSSLFSFLFLLIHDFSVITSRSCCFPCCAPRCQFWPRSFCSQEKAMTAFKGVWTQEFWRCVGAEFFAMLLFILLSLGSTINWEAVKEDPSPPDLVLISLCFGLSIATMVQCFGHISGAHINPAVTVAMVLTRKLSLAKALLYLLAQSVGAIVGAAILFGVTPASVRGSMGVTTVSLFFKKAMTNCHCLFHRSTVI